MFPGRLSPTRLYWKIDTIEDLSLKEGIDLRRWKNGSRTGKKEESKALVTVDGESVDWATYSEDDENFSFMASNSSGSDTQVPSCSNECKESYANLKRLYDAHREQLSDASVEINAYTQGLKKVEAKLVAHQQVSEPVVNESNIEVQPKDNPHRTLKNKGIIDSGCSRHMTGNKAYLADFQDFNGGSRLSS
ncbi:hypothetical protein Tco_0179552 [Tanacetum coccineum]